MKTKKTDLYESIGALTNMSDALISLFKQADVISRLIRKEIENNLRQPYQLGGKAYTKRATKKKA